MENNTANLANFSPTSNCYLAFLPRLERSVGLVGLTKLHNALTQPVSDGTLAQHAAGIALYIGWAPIADLPF